MVSCAYSVNPGLPGLLEFDGRGTLALALGDRHETWRVGQAPGQVAAVCMWSCRGTFDSTWGFWRTTLYELVLLDAAHTVLARIPAGGGWVETFAPGSWDPVNPAWRGAKVKSRMVPVWSEAEIRHLCAAAGLTLCAGKTRWPLWTQSDAVLYDDAMSPPQMGAVRGTVADGFTARPVTFNNGALTPVWVGLAFAVGWSLLGAAGFNLSDW